MELCSVCSQLVLPPPFLEEQILGPYDELLRKSRSLGPGRAGCGGCAFFSAIVGSSKRWCDRIPELLDSIIILIFNGLRVRASSGPIDLLREQTDGDLELKTYVVEEKTGVPQCNSYPDRRLVPSNPHESSCFDLISQWISQCTEHVDCSPPVPVALPKRVIEISNDRLVPPKLQITNGALGRYVILSHCWGSKGLMTLTKSLLPQYQEAISFELLPNSFRDAIEITRQLGFRYLWIDALCIVQNDTEDWAQEAGKMASYYGLSTLMISATAAEDSSKGILNPRKASHSPVLGQGKRGFLCPIPLQSHIDIDRSVLATRGWAAQERMLAPRVLHYTKQQMIWECAYGIFYEASDDEGHRPYHNAMYTKSKCQHFVTKAFSQEDTVPHYQDHNTKMPGRGFEDTSLERIETWHRCIAMYSSRSLTVPNDKLHAIAGVAKMLNHSGQLGEYLAGIWSTHLAYSLSWKSKLGNLSSPPSYTAPSWSWASVKGGVNRGIMYSRRPIDNANKSWTTRFYPKLIEQHIVSQDEHNVYGAVLEGSYIIVEGACLTRTDFDRILKTAFVTHHSGYHYGIYHDSEDRAEGQPHDLGTSDYCMYLIGDAARGAELEFLLLCWVDQEASVAQRVGIAQITSYVAEQFIGIFEAANWERRTLKLV